jgi:hypothetical protein
MKRWSAKSRVGGLACTRCANYPWGARAAEVDLCLVSTAEAAAIVVAFSLLQATGEEVPEYMLQKLRDQGLRRRCCGRCLHGGRLSAAVMVC